MKLNLLEQWGVLTAVAQAPRVLQLLVCAAGNIISRCERSSPIGEVADVVRHAKGPLVAARQNDVRISRSRRTGTVAPGCHFYERGS